MQVASPPANGTSEARVAELDAALARERTALALSQELVAKLTAERDQLRASHERLRLELELLRRRIFVAKAERVDTAQLELEFAKSLEQLDRLGGAPEPEPASAPDDDGSKPPSKGPKSRPTGRRNLRDIPMEEERIEIPDPPSNSSCPRARQRAWGTRRAARSPGSAAANDGSSSLV